MPDQFVEVTRTGWGKNIVNSIVGVLVGLAMFIVSFVVLWKNEGRVNLGKVAETAVAVNPANVDVSAEGKLVSLTGPIQTAVAIGDPEYLKPGNYVTLKRVVEMYAWVEEKETKTEKKAGGTTEEKTTYTYKKSWTHDPEETSEFKYPEGHENPIMTIQGEDFSVDNARIGAYNFDPRSTTLPGADEVPLTAENAIVPRTAALIGNQYIFVSKGTFEQPVVGDIRISFEAVNADKNITLFGKEQGSSIVAYVHKGKTRLLRALDGTREEAILQLKTEHKIMGWILRIVGFVLMWIGLTLVAGPISAVLDVLPFLGNISRGLIGVIAFFVALVLSIMTILIAMIFHNMIALIIFLIVVFVIIFAVAGRRKKTASP